jgi:hypothetical protein
MLYCPERKNAFSPSLGRNQSFPCYSGWKQSLAHELEAAGHET